MEVGLSSISRYKSHLDTLFANQPDNDILLKLEWYSSDISSSNELIFDYFKDHEIDLDAFGSNLMQGIKSIIRRAKYAWKRLIQEFYQNGVNFQTRYSN